MKILELNHVAIHVNDVEASCAFYGGVLELEPMARPAFDFPGAWFRLGPAQELHIIGGRQEPVFAHNRGNHFALRVDDLPAWEDSLKRKEVVPMGRRRRPDGAEQLFLKDPDGHVVELFTFQPGDRATRHE
ncbi:MAG: glyoxalase [Verrucomicrobia bacterium]|nr:glyoxalase [Verrucomicrobiota bacterium]